MNDRHDASEEFSLERRRRAVPASAREKAEDEARATAPNQSSSAEVTDSAFPDRIRRKYYVVASGSEKDGSDREARLYADERKEYLAFKATDDRLVTRIAAAEVTRDMVSVVHHRQWEALHVRGSIEFRREAWLEASARGIEVQGYQPSELDRQALADRGVGIVTDVADSGARPGDRISLRRDGVEPVVRAIKSIDAATGLAGIERRQMWRNMWSVTVEERRADRPAAMHDSDLLAAQSQIVVINKLVERALPNDENARRSIMAFAKERIAQHIEKGRSFARASIIEPVRDRKEQSARAEGPLQLQNGERIRRREHER